MPSSFESRFERGREHLQNAFAVEIVVRRGAMATDPFEARRNPKHRQIDGAEMNASTRVAERVYVLPVADLILGGDPLTPMMGDRIEEPGDGVWEIMRDDRLPAVRLLEGGYEYEVTARKVSD